MRCDWASKAACSGADTSKWFPADDGDDADQWQEAKRVCARCPVAAECLDEAVRERHSDGIWGGVGADRRRWLSAVLAAVPARHWIRIRDRELFEVRRWAGHDVGPVPVEPQRPCLRCPDVVPEGRHPVDRNGPDASCGIVSTYNKGCRCLRCKVAKSTYDRKGRSRTSRPEQLRLFDP